MSLRARDKKFEEKQCVGLTVVVARRNVSK